MTDNAAAPAGPAPGDRLAGAALIVAAAGSVFAMAHHPSGGNGGPLNAIVHGAMILLLGGIAYGFFWLCLRRGLRRPAILAGALAYTVSMFAHVGAATINGFVVPALAGRGPGAVSPDILLFAWESNQALARLGVVATGLAFLCWSVDFLRRPGLEPRLIGAIGLLAGAAPIALLAAGALRMDVAGAFLVYAAHAVWAALVGLHLWRGRVG